ncbi:hypothetical protein C8R47DRAFT_811761 [Mycena vitilis]|nr:hypothetical protein C8R47DRAFT_811761 [Mycena vitilis]
MREHHLRRGCVHGVPPAAPHLATARVVLPCTLPVRWIPGESRDGIVEHGRICTIASAVIFTAYYCFGNVAIVRPTAPGLNGSFRVGTFYLQKNGKTGILALAEAAAHVRYSLRSIRFSGADFDGLLQGLLTALGAIQFIINVTNNGDRFICIAHWLYQIIVGPKSTSVPRDGLDTKARDGPLARPIVQQIIDKNLDPD